MKPFVIHLTDTISAINQRMAAHLPHLRLRIADHTGNAINGPQTEVRLTQLLPEAKTPLLTIRPTMTVSEFEKAWQTEWGLSIEVFRRNGYAWADTDYTKFWTLQEQNEKGETYLNGL